MGLGAVFGALNTMYSAVAERAREIAVLRAIGFGGGAIVLSFFVEALIIALVGGVVGCVAVLPVERPHHRHASTGRPSPTWPSRSASRPDLLAIGMVFALLMGAVGRPAARDPRRPRQRGPHAARLVGWNESRRSDGRGHVTARGASAGAVTPAAARPWARGRRRATRGRSRSRCRRARATRSATTSISGWTAVGQPAKPWMSSRADEPEHAAEDAPGHGEQRALDEELRGHVAPAGAERAAHAHLAGALGDAREHDVHDPDPAHEQADRRHRTGDHVEDALGALPLAQDLARHDDLEGRPAGRAAHEGLGHAAAGTTALRRRHAEDDLVDAVRPRVGAVVEGGRGGRTRSG